MGAQEIVVDILVLNSMNMGHGGPFLQAELGATWKAFEANVHGLLDYAQRFRKQGEGRLKFPVFCVSEEARFLHGRDWETPHLLNVAL
ncbi:hypothetical protein VTH06DRAFT_4744 [Thermothelomyces fergusii]